MSYPSPGPAPDRGSIQTSAIWLIVVGFLCGGTLPAIFGIIALVQMDTDPYSARRMNKVGWIIFWILLALGILLVLAYFLIFGLVFGMTLIPMMGDG
ncbi:hypothetical protein [Brachybacterium sacelli]|uniref:Purine-cytosine permease-like protein n=1 Tax=Brachybacterium sacelli TaxID=173364 RepID=A0ABS4X2S3_9MICO|nr:hypothetical protein [Brachybacterium sacelli]MBP2382740.1 purine-cytosine permease-like protein [Brachybacterium sacelli]